MNSMEALGKEVYERIRKHLPPERSTLPEVSYAEPFTYKYTHTFLSWAADTFEVAFQAWKNDLFAHLDNDRPDWMWWRVKPEVDHQTDYSGVSRWVVASRASWPSK